MIDLRCRINGVTMFSLRESDGGYSAQCILGSRPDREEFVVLSNGGIMQITDVEVGRWKGPGSSWHGSCELRHTKLQAEEGEKVTPEQIEEHMAIS